MHTTHTTHRKKNARVVWCGKKAKLWHFVVKFKPHTHAFNERKLSVYMIYNRNGTRWVEGESVCVDSTNSSYNSSDLWLITKRKSLLCFVSCSFSHANDVFSYTHYRWTSNGFHDVLENTSHTLLQKKVHQIRNIEIYLPIELFVFHQELAKDNNIGRCFVWLEDL
jgi:hypothetical protein